jgi:ubiquinone/menaquinone biosynthesis C-methylase UbiE
MHDAVAHLRHRRNRNRPSFFQGHPSRLYDVVARRLVRGIYRRIADDLVELAPHNGTILDVGTGPGVLLQELGRRRPDLRVVGIDLSADMVAAARRNVAELGDRADVRQADVADLPFPDASFDLVVSSLSLHHWDDPPAAAPHLARVLKPGGRLYIYDFRFAPFDALATADAGFTGPPRRTVIRTGIPVPRRLVRHVMFAEADATGGPSPSR